ncbi:MAG: hypothetical protein KKH68_07060 [Proteobacteria bacterium]|nr:hypothetical protein [Pseudomonadota bacterium]
MDKSQNLTLTTDNKFRHWMAIFVLTLSIGGLIMLSIIVVAKGEDPDSAKYVFAAVLPLLGTWVGTLLAFYFSKENFESATRSVREMAVGLTGIEKLKSVKVTEAMRSFKEITFFPLKKGEENQVRLNDLLNTFKDLERMPLIDNQQMVYLVYKGMIYMFISQKAMKKEDVSNLTLKDLFESDSSLKLLFEKSFGFVSKAATLAEAKTVMDAISKTIKCEDVFVTENGKPDEPILGWITNKAIARYAKV